ALVCYDMGSLSQGRAIALGSGAVTTELYDLSGKGNIAAVSGARLAPISYSASGLGLDFDGVDDSVTAGDIGDFESNAPFTVNVWFTRLANSNEYVRIVSKEKITSPREGWLLFVHPLNSGWANRIGFERWSSGS